MNIKEHYNKLVKNKQDRHKSAVANIRYANNFIKAIFIRMYAKQKMLVLDLGCGKGGDLKKFDNAKISEYYGLDIAEVSVYDARKRHNDSENTFRAYFDNLDVYNTPFDLKKEFDLISCQFSLHYAFSSQKSLEITVRNINKHLRIGGYFIFTVPNKDEILYRYNKGILKNEFYKIRYDGTGNFYYFTLKDCVNDCIEYFVDMKLLKELLEFYNIKMVRREFFDDFYFRSIAENRELAKRMKCGELRKEEIEVISLYEFCVFKKF
ncbi:hypothetical protein NCER_100590 [Vairimorpha ceranae BRL01]|uniref:mRNA cap guanine-N(7) methyltransferase n=2 Tax=Vairimorpha ceranae TaxID=40302 RepID=C4V7Z2_VAIC1|nr:mrna capping enzyme [Vairimorpha ceranae]EEQ82659.1 hypothetical protein NCER_100590 [Vairimorpha ceranae BRL01]KAF5141153.1 hypothetical protein G9O61_00g004690 [Vairimorpha ceranae]KKO75954.1 mrna capping enzyme [Vairimorpha ceranae]